MDTIIRLESVEKTYYGAVDTKVLFDINLDFQKGSINSIIGESGSGKTTLLNIIGTLDKPTGGEVIIDGTRTSILGNNSLAELRNKTIGFVFQFHHLLPEFTAIENVLIPLLINNKKLDETVMQSAKELFNLLGITNVMNNPSARMSGGQQQRTAIVRALINNPKIILADEPTGNLDSENTEMIYRLFRKLRDLYGITFLIVTHDQRIADHTDRIVEIKDGRILHDNRGR
jgi:lipoprotein-releasing system ATP-binding protein